MNEVYFNNNISLKEILKKKDRQYEEKQAHLKEICAKHKVNNNIFKDIQNSKNVNPSQLECVDLFLKGLDAPYMYYKGNASLERSFTKLKLIDKPIGEKQTKINFEMDKIKKNYHKEQVKGKL